MTAHDLTPYREKFQAEGLKHIHEQLTPSEWGRYRGMAANEKNWPPGTQEILAPDITKEELVTQGTTESSGMSMCELFAAFPSQKIIGNFDGRPIYYIEASGIYIWSLTNEAPVYLDLWLSYPAYPPGW